MDILIRACFGRTVQTIAGIFLLSISLSAQEPKTQEIKLKNGDRLTGTIVERTDTEITLKTTYAGTIKITTELVEKVQDPEPIKPKPGVPADTIAVKKDAVKPDKPAPPPIPKRVFGGGKFFGLMNGWDGVVDAGMSYSAGNSDTTTLATSINAVKTAEMSKLRVYLRNVYNSSRDTGHSITTQNAVFGGVRYDRDVNKKMFGFVTADFDRNIPKRLKLRTILGSGLGYHVINDDRTTLDLLFGFGWNRTALIDSTNSSAEALASSVLKHRLNGRFRLENAATYYQNPIAGSDFRFVLDNRFIVDLSKRFSMFVSVSDRFDNLPAAGTEKNDFLFATGLRVSFGNKSKK